MTDTTEKHIDLEEAIFWNDGIAHHYSGPNLPIQRLHCVPSAPLGGLSEAVESQAPFQYDEGVGGKVYCEICFSGRECPSSTCPTGRHTVIPEECLEWWITQGWFTLEWRGAREEADSNAIDAKIKRFLLNHKAKSRQQTLQESQNDVQSQASAPDDASTNYDANNRCGSCDQIVDLLAHLYEDEGCLKEYMQHYLPEDLCRGVGYQLNMRKSIFHLSVIMKMCARVDCPARNSSRYFTQHLNENEDCLDFYRNEGVFIALPNWKADASAHIVGKKLQS